jgi:hypothetical protein
MHFILQNDHSLFNLRPAARLSQVNTSFIGVDTLLYNQISKKSDFQVQYGPAGHRISFDCS